MTVLFADLVGFTSRAESLDPEDVDAILRPYHERLRSELERHGGTVEKFIGDAVMALFGAPVAHEDDPERAVRAALAIREAMTDDGRLQVRIAVTTGEALVTLGARPSEGEGMAAGDVVNTAARLQSAAPVNGILVDETTYRATRDVDPLRRGRAGEREGKGRAGAGLGGDSRRGRGSASTSSRRERRSSGGGASSTCSRGALARVRAGARRRSSSRSSACRGSVRAGSSFELYRRRRRRGGAHLLAAGPLASLRRRGHLLGARRDGRRRRPASSRRDAPEEAEQKLTAMVGALASRGRGADARRPAAARGPRQARARRAATAASGSRPGGGSSRRSPSSGRPCSCSRTCTGPTTTCSTSSTTSSDWASGVPLLVVCTARPELLERRPGWGGGKPNALTLSISPLSDDETARLLARLLERAVLPAETQSTLLARAGGNPLYAEQFARLLAETGRASELPLPENVQGIIAARLDGLPPDEKQLLQDAAVVGKVFWLGAASSRRRPSTASKPRSVSTRSSERSSFAASAGHRSAARASTPFATSSSATSPTARSPAAGRAEQARARRRVDRVARSAGRPRRDARAPLPERARASPRSRRGAPRELVERARAARDAGDRVLALGLVTRRRRSSTRRRSSSGRADDRGATRAPARHTPERAWTTPRWTRLCLQRPSRACFVPARSKAPRKREVRLGDVWLNRGDRDRALEHLERARELVSRPRPVAREDLVLQELAPGR